ncbi:hypothetical protein BDW59DRAFT_141476 [Aspergillus cavernicola]|uniref:Pentatricopeptide repeat protein n=1 Tax=Aspergillus cavernicola TaxID=176166 RepID=A0ABR4IQA2_9EURO
MQRIWSRSAPAGPTSHCVSCLSTIAEGVASRTASAASKRRLRFGNSVTALYTSIFAAAALADARAKGNRRLEWEEKIAAVKDEVHELVDEEERLLEALASRRTTPNPLRRALQRRPFYTLPRPSYRSHPTSSTQPQCRSAHFRTRTNATEEFDEQIVEHHEVMEDSFLQELSSENRAPMEDVDDHYMAIDVEEVPKWLGADLVRGKVIRKLALKQLAIRLILRPAIAHSYMGVLKNYDAADAYPQLDLASLLYELNAIRSRIRRIKTNPQAPIEDLASELRVRRLKETVHETVQLDKQIRQEMDLYSSDQMPLEELLLRLSNHLLQARDPDRTYVFMMMIIGFTKTRQNDLAELVVKTILPYKFPLSSSIIVAIINFFRKSKDLKGFDLFLRMLRGQGYPVDMGNLGYFKKKYINGLEITAPPVHSANIVTYAALIKACLRFDQPDRADAYLLAARAAGCMDDFAILMAYLKFYTIRGDWEKGLQVLQRSLAFIASTTEHPVERVERLIALMVRLCDSCDKFEVSEALIKAAVDGGFSSRIPQRQEDIIFEADPEFHRWREAAEVSPKKAKGLRMGDKCYKFVKIAKGHLDPLTIPEEESSAQSLHNLQGIYSSQLLSSVVDGGLAHKQLDQEGQLEGADNDNQSKTAKIGNSSLHYSMAAAHQQEIGHLKNEIAQLKQMVFHLFQSPNAPALPQSAPNDPSELKKRLVPSAPTLSEARLQRSNPASASSES